MDLQSASSLSGRHWQLARVGAVLFLVLSCGFLVTSLLDSSRPGQAEKTGITRIHP
jgi:hypothetical protein